MGIDLKAGGKSKKTKRTAPKSNDIYLKLLVRLYRFIVRRTPSRFNKVVSLHEGKGGKIVVVMGNVTDDIRVCDVLAMKMTALKLTWTAMYGKQHKKDISQEDAKKRRCATKKPYSRFIVGATLEVIQKKRSEKPEVRDAAREAALREIKERIKKTKDEKKAKKAEVASKAQKSGKSNVQKGGLPKGPKLGGGGGKR